MSTRKSGRNESSLQVGCILPNAAIRNQAITRGMWRTVNFYFLDDWAEFFILVTVLMATLTKHKLGATTHT